MWAVWLCLLAAFAVGFMVSGGPALWFAALVGLAVFGGDPSEPVAAAIATVLAFLGVGVAREAIVQRFRR